MATATFKRGDGAEFIVDEGSVAFDLMTKDGGFTLVREDAEPEPAGDGPVDLSKLSKKQLFEEAAIRDIPVTDKMTKDQIIEAINGKS